VARGRRLRPLGLRVRQDDVLGRRLESAAAAAFFVLLVAAALASRRRPDERRASAHAAGLAVAAAGFAVFAVANRRLYSAWGGVAGWYLWDWSPWLAMAASDLRQVRPDAERTLVAAVAVFAAVSNAVWLAAHAAFYGG